MTIPYRPGKLHGNADALSRINKRPGSRENCPDHGHLIKKVKSLSEKTPSLLCAIQTVGLDGSQDLDNHPDLVPLLSDGEIRITQKQDPELCGLLYCSTGTA